MKENDLLFLKCTASLLDALGYPQLDLISTNTDSDIDDTNIYTNTFNRLSDIHLKPKLRTIRSFSRINAPCILLRKNNYPLVILKTEESIGIVYNPKNEEVEYIKSLESNSQLLNFEKINHTERRLSETTKNWTFQLLKKFTFIISQASVLCSITNILTMVTPIFILIVFSQINNNESSPDFHYILIGMIAYIAANFIFLVAKSYTLSFISARLSFLISTEYLKRLMTLEIKYSNTLTLSSQIPQFTKINKLSNGIGNEIFERIFDLLYLVIMVIIIFFLAGTLALIPLATFLVFLSSCAIYVPYTKKNNASYATNKQKVNDFLNESVTHLKTLSSTSSESTWLEKGKEILFNKVYDNEKKTHYSQTSQIISQMTVQIATLATIYLGVSKVINQELSVPSLMACVFFLWKALTPLKSILILTLKINESFETIKSIDKFMSLDLEEDNLKLRSSIINIKNIKLKSITAKYPSGNGFALRSINMQFSKNETTFIYGKDGSGKNSVINIFLGLLRPQIGNVFINDFNLTQYNLRELRKSVAISPPVKISFNMKIIELCRHYNNSISDNEIIKHFKMFKLDKIESLLSVAQKDWDYLPTLCEYKRLSIAITLLKSSSLYIFRDITKGLSPLGIEVVKDYLNKEQHKKTIIITSSDLTLINAADKIIQLDEGKLAYSGAATTFLNKYKKAI